VAWQDQTFLRVQVKSAHLRKHKDRHPCYKFQNTGGRMKKALPTLDKFDILAHCSIDQRRVYFQAACCVNKCSQRRAPGWFQEPGLEEDSWEKAVAIIMEARNR